MFAEIIIPLVLPKNYIWAIPARFQALVSPGIRVEVLLGRNKKYAGIIKKITLEKPAAFEPKEILQVIDETPILHPTQLEFWEWIAAYYMCTEGEVMQAAVPANLKLTSESILIWNEDRTLDFSDLTDDEYVVAEALHIKKELRLSEVQQLVDSSHVYPLIKKLIEKEVCFIWEALKDKYKAKRETFIRLSETYNSEASIETLLNNWTKAPKQMELLLVFLHLQKTQETVIQSELLKKAGASAAQLKGLIEKGILIAEKKAVDRFNYGINNAELENTYTLSEAQTNAYNNLVTLFDTKPVCLLHGVTASGKTQIYIKLIESFIAKDQQALYMLPEIALTAQMIRRLQYYFGDKIAIYHSKFNANERVEIWNKVNSGQIKIVLGARSSLLLPFKNLGLIIADEEHDPSYKQQDPAPRYHARDAAIYYATLFNAKVLLGSATPSIESYYNALQQKFGLVSLQERFGAATLPTIDIINVQKLPKKGKVALTEPLIAAIQETLAKNKQVILFQNRRGYAPYMICDTCGWIPQCKQCDVTLTYHKAKNTLTCHYCGSNYPVVHQCAACGSNQFTQKNFGTEQIQELLSELLPDARIARMDHDSVKGKNEHDALIKLFEQRAIDILVGTQMVVKGLDFEHVNLVGIIDADGILSFTDFRVNEKAYQLMEQVSGRAGRKDDQGKVLIQVSQANHPVLQFVQGHNYPALFDFEIHNRQAFNYPPFSRIILITCKHLDKNIAQEAANILMRGLSSSYGKYITGPAQPVVDRIRNQYLWELLCKIPKQQVSIGTFKNRLQQQIMILQTNKRYRSVSIVINVDPL